MATENNEENRGFGTNKVALILTIAGLILFSVHFFLLQQQVPDDENWLISIESSLTTDNTDVSVNIQPPYESEYHRIVRRSINHAGLRIVPPNRNSVDKRSIRLRPNRPGKNQIEVQFTLQLSNTPRFHPSLSKELTTKRRQFFLSDNDQLQLDSLLFESILTEIGENMTGLENLPDRIFQFVRSLAQNDSAVMRNAPTILSSRKANHYERALLMTALCRKSGIPARVVTGLELKDDPIASPDYWVEANINDKWIIFHPGLGYRDSLPVNYLAFDKYGGGILAGHLADGTVFAVENEILVERMPESIKSPDNSSRVWYQIFIFDRLPFEARQELALLMLLPLGALLTCLVRQVGGLRSYGVFTPTILALAMTYAERETTMLMIAIILSLVYFGRPAFKSKMARTPRLSIIFTIVAVSMVLGVSILDYFSLASDGHLILLPIVILTSLIDRFFSAVESHGYHTAFVRLAWTLTISIAILPILTLLWLGNLILRYPEIHLFTLSLFILISGLTFKQRKLPKWLGFLSEHDTKKERKKLSTENTTE